MKDWLNYWILLVILGTVATRTNYFTFFSGSEIMSGLFFNCLIFVLPVWLVARADRKRNKAAKLLKSVPPAPDAKQL